RRTRRSSPSPARACPGVAGPCCPVVSWPIPAVHATIPASCPGSEVRPGLLAMRHGAVETGAMTSTSRRALTTGLLAVAFGVAPAPIQDRPEPKAAGGPFPVAIRIDASKTQGEMRPVWRFFGHDEPNYTYMKDGRKLLGQLAALSPEPVYIRTHNL